jgi:hypothetical protein
MNISFSLTTAQFLNGEKTVTRRLGWKYLKPGQILTAVEKSQGLKKGEKVKRLGTIEILSVRRERLSQIDPSDVIKEGFPSYSIDSFVAMFCRHMKCRPSTIVTRIEFKKL